MLTTTKLRARLRARESGAILIIVAMVLAAVASIGLFAMRAAQTDVQTSGHARQSAQTRGIGQYAILASADALGMNGVDRVANCVAFNRSGVPDPRCERNADSNCRSVRGYAVNEKYSKCWHVPSDITAYNDVNQNARGALDAPDGGVAGSLGPAINGSSMGGAFDVEIGVPHTVRVPGCAADPTSTLCLAREFPVVVYGRTAPVTGADAGTISVAREEERAWVITSN